MLFGGHFARAATEPLLFRHESRESHSTASAAHGLVRCGAHPTQIYLVFLAGAVRLFEARQ